MEYNLEYCYYLLYVLQSITVKMVSQLEAVFRQLRRKRTRRNLQLVVGVVL